MLPSEFLLSYASFNADNKPFVECQVDGKIERYELFGQDLSLEFDFSVKYCTGWVDFENRCSQICPDHATVDEKYENCLKCRDKTGFNPAFYNASSVSIQQEKINQNPHFVYLAYFAPNVIKVGISQEERGIRRLLEQGARLAIKLETFSSALIARQYEAKISKLDGIVETLPVYKKLELIKQPFDYAAGERELRQKLLEIEQKIGVSFPKSELIPCEDYFQTAGVDLSRVVLMKNYSQLVGHVRSVIGSIIITDYDGQLLAYNIKKLIGYRAQKVDREIELDLPTEQLTLF
ncbi:DUF2797 domain-containing protein [Candidatus Nanosynbacter sp. TM7-057]|uniref:DUF2797 domain-containing protein n=1 Tax=Candidatus Nanosynbacter sp. TM7-057 TaxID=2902630 RepID=UPI001FB7018A|nr:DUF2797 domain-containing protein [Candidatus Nanosynbacter sp. TM7-057]MCJ1964460.1 DUF2797 domain-containing protein [Candidatus Nanosynbacter sp. TM7-057]